MMKLFKRNQKGFTLVELVVVIAILGILAAIAVPRFIASLEEARSTADEANMRVLQTAVDLFYAETEGYPADYAALEGALVPTYIDEIPELSGGGTFNYNGTTGTVSIPAATP